MATNSSSGPRQSETSPHTKGRSALPLENLVRLLARQAAREAVASWREQDGAALGNASSEIDPTTVVEK